MKLDNTCVRRQDRLMDEPTAYDILRNGEYGFLAMESDTGGGYGVPINFIWDGDSRIYLHCAPEGRKLRCIAANPNVTFCVVGKTHVLGGMFTTNYQSVLLRGKASIGLSAEEREAALKMLVAKYSPEYKEIGDKYIKMSFHRTEVIRIDIDTYSAKQKQVKNTKNT